MWELFVEVFSITLLLSFLISVFTNFMFAYTYCAHAHFSPSQLSCRSQLSRFYSYSSFILNKEIPPYFNYVKNALNHVLFYFMNLNDL